MDMLEQAKKDIFDSAVAEAAGNMDIATAGVLVGQFSVMNRCISQQLIAGGNPQATAVGLASLDSMGSIFAAAVAKLCDVMKLNCDEVTRIAGFAAEQTIKSATAALKEKRAADTKAEVGNATVH